MTRSPKDFTMNRIQLCVMISGNCSIRHCDISPNMVYSKGWSCLCCCLPTNTNFPSCCHGCPNSWRPVILWRVCLILEYFHSFNFILQNCFKLIYSILLQDHWCNSHCAWSILSSMGKNQRKKDE